MILKGWATGIIDVKGAFLKGKFKNSIEIYEKIKRDGKSLFCDVCFTDEKILYGLKQAAMQF